MESFIQIDMLFKVAFGLLSISIIFKVTYIMLKNIIGYRPTATYSIKLKDLEKAREVDNDSEFNGISSKKDNNPFEV